MSNQFKAFEVTLSAAAAALSTIFLLMGTLNTFMLFLGYVLASVALMLPLSKSFIAGDVMAFIATTGLAFLLGGIAAPWRVLPFVMFFGLHPLVNHLQVKYHWNTNLLLVIKVIWFDLTGYLIWRFLFNMTTNFEWVDEFIIPVILIGGSLLFYFYDRTMFNAQAIVDRFIKKIDKNR